MLRATTTAARAVLGGYLAVHGAQKLFGTFGGRGLDATATGFDAIGLSPGRPMAILAGASELGGGLLTAAGVADPLGPIAIAGSMAVATTVHRRAGPLLANGGYELALTNAAFATLLATGRLSSFRLGPALPRLATAVVLVGAASLTALSIAKLLTASPPSDAAAAAEADEEQP